MQKILLYYDQNYRIWDEMAAALNRQGNKILYVPSEEKLIEHLQSKEFEFLICGIHDQISESLSTILTKSKSLANFRSVKIYTVHSKPNRQAFQEAILLGVNAFFLYPFDIENLITNIQTWDSQIPINTDEFQILPAYFTSLDVLGRVGKIYKNEDWNFSIETNVFIHTGKEIRLRTPIALANGLKRFRCVIKERSKRDIYFRHGNKYELKLLSEKPLEDRLEKWTKRHDFVVPKTKILYIGNSNDWHFESALEKKIFSFYFIEPKNLSIEFLNRVYPRFIVQSADNSQTNALLGEWIDSHNNSETTIYTVHQNAHDWYQLHGTNNNEQIKDFLEKAKPLVRLRVGSAVKHFKYINRNDLASRCTINFAVKIIGVSRNMMRIISPYSMEKGTVVQIGSEFYEDKTGFGLYGKILQEKSLEMGRRYELIIQCLPVSGKTNDALVEYISMLEARNNPGFVASEGRRPSQPRIFFLQHSNWFDRNKIVIFVLLGLVLLSILISLIPSIELQEKRTAPRQQIIKSIKDAF